MAESPAQNAVCVIGHPIGGNPSQFCITRVLDDWELDWQCLSFDVAPESLAAALLGIEALGFVGALIASPHELAAAQRFGEQSPRGLAVSATAAAPLATPAVPSAALSTDALPAPNPATADPAVVAAVPAAAFRWIDGLRREPSGDLVGCNFLAEAVDDLLREHQQRTGQSLAACLLLGDLAAIESATLPFASCLPPLRYQPLADGSLVLCGGSLPPSDTVSPALTLESLTEPILVIRMRGPEQPLKSKGKTTQQDDREGQGSLPRGLHPDSLIFDLAGDFSPAALSPGPGQRLPRSVTPLDLEIARLVAALRNWTGQVADRNLLADAIEEYLEI
jgi:hypothetical protein